MSWGDIPVYGRAARIWVLQTPLASAGEAVDSVKLLMMANTDWYIYNFRLPIAQRTREMGWQVVLVSPSGEYTSQIQAHGFRWLPIRMGRRGISILPEWNTLRQITGIYRREAPDIVHHFTMKPVLYGSLAARSAGIRYVVNTVAGLGYLFGSERYDMRIARALLGPVFRHALSGKRVRVVFENQADREYMVARRFVPQHRTSVIQGAGVDLDRFQPSPEPSDPCSVIMASRLLWDKGIKEFVEAARILRENRAQVRFVLVGEPDPGNPSSVPKARIQAWVEEGLIEWWGRRSDMPTVFAQSHIVALPSYREGVPTVLLEAAASGRPVVATDIPGCRAAVKDGVTGILVPPKDPQALAAAIGRLIRDPQQRRELGWRGRELMEERFDELHIVEATVEIYEELMSGGPVA